MKFAARVVSSLVVLAGLGALALAAWWGASLVGAQLAVLEPQVARVTVMACAVVLASAVLIGQRVGKAAREGRALEVREERLAAYQILLDTWSRLLREPPGDSVADAEPELRLLDRLLAMHGAAAVLQQHAAMRALARERTLAEPAMHEHFGKALWAIRRDLGADVPTGFAPAAVELLLAPPLQR